MSEYKKIGSAEGQTFDVSYPKKVVVLTDDYTVTKEDEGALFLIGIDAKVATLLATILAFRLSFMNIGAAGNNDITISPDVADGIHGKIIKPEGSNADATTADGLVSVLSGTDDKDIVNTKATADPGDRVDLIGDGDVGWWVTGGLGIWASEA